MYDEETCQYICKNKIIDLTKTEGKILAQLIKNKGKVVRFNKPQYINIHRIRRKLKGELEIITKNTIGYYIKY